MKVTAANIESGSTVTVDGITVLVSKVVLSVNDTMACLYTDAGRLFLFASDTVIVRD